MKVKYLVLTAICSMCCALGCACSQGQSGGNSSVPPTSEDSGMPNLPPVEEPIITVNQSSVTFCVGESFTLAADAENLDGETFVWAIDGDFDNEILAVEQTGNSVVITGLKSGETKLVASLQYEGHTYFKTVDVTVTETSGVSLVVSENVGLNEDGYYARLSTLSTATGDKTSILPQVSVYKNNKVVGGALVAWESQDTDVVSVNGNSFQSVGEGKTSVVGTCEVDGKPYSVAITVEVYRPTIVLNEEFVIELENLQKLQLNSSVRGLARDVLYNGKSVGSFDAQSGVITLQKSALPTQSALMGEDRTLSVETSLASYQVSVNLYTKIICTKADFDEMSALAKAAYAINPAIWDGYFVLGDDILYNNTFVSKIADIGSLWAAVGGSWSNGGLYGFKGVFDGKGHKIEGITIDDGSDMASVFGVLHIDGVVKNVSFTKAIVGANSSLVCHAGGGTIENVYVQYESMGKGTQHYEGDGSINNYCGTFFSFKEPTATANVTNCVIDVSSAFLNAKAGIKIVGSEYVSIKNVFVIGGTEEMRKKSNATLSFASAMEFVMDGNAQKRYQTFDEEFWNKTSGVPIANAVYGEIYDKDVRFTGDIDYLLSGTSYQLSLNNHYVLIESDNPNAQMSGSVISILPTARDGETIVLTATSLFDASKKDIVTCTVVSIEGKKLVNLTGEGSVFYDITEGEVYLAEVGVNIPDPVLYYVNADYSAVTYGNDGDPAREIIAITSKELYKVSCVSVTKVLSKAEDIHHIRRDYTVISYGNAGSYDGVLSGTFVLINDIDCTGLVLKNSGGYWENSRGFGGILDGRGYTISNLTVGQNGLFGAIAKATVKNLHFKNVRLDNQNSVVALFANRIFDVTVEDVSVHFAEVVVMESIYGSSGLLFHDASFDCLFKNVTIDISDVEEVKFFASCLADSDPPYGSRAQSVYENVTVIVSAMDKVPVFAYTSDYQAVEYPDGILFKVKE